MASFVLSGDQVLNVSRERLRPKCSEKLNATENAVLRMVLRDPSGSLRSFAKKLNLPRARVTKITQKLVDGGWLEPRGFHAPKHNPEIGVNVIILLTLRENAPHVIRALKVSFEKSAFVEYFMPVSGELDIVAKLNFESMSDLAAWVSSDTLKHPSIVKARQHVCFPKAALS